ncbi:MAG: phosphate ABC transporter permease subunit PstC [Defluviitaleaceae bacterium]|nr:phosphate ABC transporter permease subunit PstC [Defluviitaleaceae bacterium]
MGRHQVKETLAKILFTISACVAVVAVGLICIFLFMQGLPAMIDIGVWEFLTGTDWRPTWNPPQFGILPMIMGSLYVTAGAILFGVPIGIFAAVFMAEFCPRPLYKVLKPSINLMAGIPSVVFGYFGMVVLVPFVRTHLGGSGNSILTGSILLGMMILPTVITISENSLRAVPRDIYEGAIALGASRERAIFHTILPAAKSGVMAAIILGIGRAIGETMAVRMVTGNQAVLRTPDEFLSGVRTMTSNIVLELGYAYSGDHRPALIATGVVLFVFIMLINTLFSILRRKDGAR